MRIGMFDPALITSGRLRKVLGEWQCVGGVPIYALYRKSSPMPPKIAAFLEFVGECFAEFDQQEITLTHDPTFGESVLCAPDRTPWVESERRQGSKEDNQTPLQQMPPGSRRSRAEWV
jgi:hypothetical protein